MHTFQILGKTGDDNKIRLHLDRIIVEKQTATGSR